MDNGIVYTMNPLEYMLMCTFAGMDQTYGYLYEQGTVSEEMLIQTVYGMERKKMIQLTGGRFCLTELYQRIFHLIQTSDLCLRVFSVDQQKPEIIVYHTETKMVCLKSAVHNAQRLQLEVLDRDMFYEYLMDRGYLPEQSGMLTSDDPNEAIRHDLDHEIDKKNMKAPIEDLREENGFQCLIETVFVDNMELEKKVRLLCYRLGIWMAYVLIYEAQIKKSYGGCSVFENNLEKLFKCRKGEEAIDIS